MRVVLKSSTTPLFRSMWNLDVVYNRYFNGLALLGVLVLMVVAVAGGLMHAGDSTAVIPVACESHNPATQQGLVLNPGDVAAKRMPCLKRK